MSFRVVSIELLVAVGSSEYAGTSRGVAGHDAAIPLQLPFFFSTLQLINPGKPACLPSGEPSQWQAGINSTI
jgi:hypothetical protein